jgi:hypothetical protein
MTCHLHTFAERYDDDLNAANWRITEAGWKNFMLEDNIANRYFGRLRRDFPQFQAFLYADDDRTPIALINSIPLTWDGTLDGLPDGGWDGAMVKGCQNLDAGIAPDTLCAVGITIDRAYAGKGVSREAILGMKSLAVKAGFKGLIAPVRPSLKTRYPLTPMERYISWTTDEGAPFDPWIRTHWRVGGTILRVCDPSMIVAHPVGKWEEWTGLKFPESGQYVVEGALNPVQIDLEQDEGRYAEPNVWMLHSIP